MSEAFEPAVGVNRKFAVEVVGAGQDFFPAHATLGETKIFHEDKFGWGEAVVYFGHGDFGARVGDASLGIGIGSAGRHFVEGGVVVVGIDRPSSGSSGERKRLYIQRVVGVLVRVFGSAQDRSC